MLTLSSKLQFLTFIFKAGFYESKFQSIIPNPAYDNAAKIIGKYFLEYSRDHELIYDEVFPGKFSASKEFSLKDSEARQFFLTAYYRGKLLSIFSITFAHSHDHFDFPSPPVLKLEKQV